MSGEKLLKSSGEDCLLRLSPLVHAWIGYLHETTSPLGINELLFFFLDQNALSRLYFIFCFEKRAT